MAHRGVAVRSGRGLQSRSCRSAPDGSGRIHMTIDRRALAGVLAALLLVAACGGSATPAPTAPPGATGTPAAGRDARAERPQEPTETAGADRGAGCVVRRRRRRRPRGHAARARSTASRSTRTSFDGNVVPGRRPDRRGDDEFEQFLKDNGKSPRATCGSRSPRRPTRRPPAGSMVMAIQIQGARLRTSSRSGPPDSRRHAPTRRRPSAARRSTGPRRPASAPTSTQGRRHLLRPRHGRRRPGRGDLLSSSPEPRRPARRARAHRDESTGPADAPGPSRVRPALP